MNATKQEEALRSIGKYQVVAKLAEGAVSVVYKCRDPKMGATVAIKIASVALARDKVLLKRFEQEYKTTANLSHPNIVRALEFGWEGQRPFIVMELVDGEDLWARIDRLGKLNEAEAVDYIIQVSKGLHEAHKGGIIHRDLKPDNILLAMDGQAKLADLGLSKDLEMDLGLTRDNHGLGTPNFIAPEQFADAKHSGVRSDIYALGATLYMAVTGQLPFAGDDLGEILKMKVGDKLVAPRKLVPTLSEPVDWAIRRAVLADPVRRFSSCPEFIAALLGEIKAPTARANAKPRNAPRASAAQAAKLDRERRTAMRYECALPTTCTINPSVHCDAPEEEPQADAQVCDLSAGGIGLLLARRFEPGSILTIVVSSESGHFQRTRDLRVLRVTKADGQGWFLAGTLLEKFSKDELRQLL
jgi:serine/threonine protein kinase